MPKQQYTEHAFNVGLSKGTKITISYVTRNCDEHGGALDGVWEVTACLAEPQDTLPELRTPLPTPPITALKITTATFAETSGHHNSSTQPAPVN